MADSTVADVNKMKVVDLRRELKTRGLSATGDKAELVTRLQAAMSQASDSNDEHGDINLDSDIDSDGVLEDEDDKSHGDILDDSAVDTLNDELALAEQPVKSKKKPQIILKRKIIASDLTKFRCSDDKSDDNTGDKEPLAKKIVLNRTTSISSIKPTEEKTDEDTPETPAKSNKVKITADVDTKSKLELRAQRFGMPVKMSEAERKEARIKRFGQGSAESTISSTSISAVPTGSLSENLDKLKKRAERFGQSVSKIMTDIENKEKLEKRKTKFSAA